MKKNNPPKRPRGRQPAGAILVDGKWQLTELSIQLAAERLLRHNDHLVRVRIDLEHDHTRGVGDQFAAKGHIEIGGPDLIASVRSDDAYKSLDLLSDRLDRMLRERSRTRTDRRNNTARGEKFRPDLAAD